MIETKAASSMGDAEMLAKQEAGVQWCRNATDYSVKHGGRAWRYLLIPHDVIAENRTLEGLAAEYCSTSGG